ncbi:U6 snRNA-associated Sm-like protein LSm1 [Brevipalpus obovatus]|uniref:U6 snRNA-associated Sm-like protein LSm1 n=1 Tax=Brevipalpus obovatus TaxID=246614 RepID=UPI003D9E6DFF
MDTYLTGATSLINDVDKKMMVLLRDGRTLIGFLRSVDQFANLVMHRTIERIHVKDKYGDIDIGLILIRGENVVLCGEIDVEKEIHSPLTKVAAEEILDLQQSEITAKQERLKMKSEGFPLESCLDFLDDF